MDKKKKERASQKALAKKLKEVEVAARKKAIKNAGSLKGIQTKSSSSLFDLSKKEKPGKNNWRKFGFDLHPQVTFFSVIILTICIVLTLLFSSTAENVFSTLLNEITETTGWIMIFAVNIFIAVAFYFAFSKYGKIVLGGPDAKPDFSRFAWYAMLLSAGMGIGLVFWSVAEPINHLIQPSPMFSGIASNSPEAAQAAMSNTFLHWGIHPWAIYAIVGLGLAFFSYNKGLPLTIRSVFYPIIGNKIYGLWGNLIDTLAVLATLTGLATSLGLGVSQVNAGLNHLFGVEISTSIQVILVVVITGLATISVIKGLDGGVKKLSEINMIVAGIFMLLILIIGPTIYIFSGFTQNIGHYFANFIEMSLWTETFKGTNWQGTWTIFYWAWWISWSPFVGMFIARVSKGRTVREFIMGVIVVPTIASFIWMSVLGGTSIFQQINGVGDIASYIMVDESLAMFAMLDNLPMSTILSIVGMILIVIFFVTSSDSGSLVVCNLTSGGKLDSPVKQRVLWAVMEGLIAATLLIGGGLTALQTASIITGLPFTLILLVMTYSLFVGLKQEYKIESAVNKEVKIAENKHVMNEVISSVVHDEALIDKEPIEK